MVAYAHAIASLGLAVALVASNALPAQPHAPVDPDGSKTSCHPRECRNDGDCRPVAKVSLAADALWMTTVDGHIFLIGPSETRRASMDMRWHICVGHHEADNLTPRIMCVFAPPDT